MSGYIKPTCCYAWLIPYHAQIPLETIQKKNKAFVFISLIGMSEKDQKVLDSLQIINRLAAEVRLIAKRKEGDSLVVMVDRFKVVATCTNQPEVKERLIKKKVYPADAFMQGQFQDALSMIFYEISRKCIHVKNLFELAIKQAITLQEEAEVSIEPNSGALELIEPSKKEAEVQIEFFKRLRK